MTDTHWLFGDQLGPSFLAPGGEGPARDAPVVMIESRSVFGRRRFHRAKAHLILSAMRHRAAELGDRVTYVRADTYREGLRRAAGHGPVTVHHPTSRAALRLVRSLADVTVLPPRGFLVAPEDFAAWAGGQRTLSHRLAGFGAYEAAMLADDGTMSHSLLSSSLNLGLLDPAECVEEAEAAWRAGEAPLHSVEGFVRQIAG